MEPSSSFVVKAEQREREEEEEVGESENNKGVKKRATEAGTSLLSVPNEEKACGDHYQEASLTSYG